MAKIYLNEWAKLKNTNVLTLSKELGLSQSGLSLVASGKNWPKPETIDKLAKALKIESHQLLQDPSTIEPDNQIKKFCPHCGNPIDITINKV